MGYKKKLLTKHLIKLSLYAISTLSNSTPVTKSLNPVAPLATMASASIFGTYIASSFVKEFVKIVEAKDRKIALPKYPEKVARDEPIAVSVAGR